MFTNWLMDNQILVIPQKVKPFIKEMNKTLMTLEVIHTK